MRRRLSKSGGGLALEAELGGDYGYDELFVAFFDAADAVSFPDHKIHLRWSFGTLQTHADAGRKTRRGVWSPEDLLNELAPGGQLSHLFPQTKSPSGAKWLSQNRKISGFPESGSKKFPEKSGRKKFAECAKKKPAASARLVGMALGEAYPLDGGLKVVAAV